jgi:uncharacterized protein
MLCASEYRRGRRATQKRLPATCLVQDSDAGATQRSGASIYAKETDVAYDYLDIAVTPNVRTAQAAMGSDRLWTDREFDRKSDRFTPQEAQFIGERDSFYIATVSETGWPYVQHRGGPRGFLRVIDDRTLAFADYRGNRQYISIGNLAADNRASLILMDYAQRTRLKIYAHVEIVAPEVQPALGERVAVAPYKARIERIFVLRLDAFDWNCPQHITPRYTEDEIDAAVQPLRERLAQLEQENTALKARLAAGT